MPFAKWGGVAPRDSSRSSMWEKTTRKMGITASIRERRSKRLLSWFTVRLVAILEMKPGHMYFSNRLSHPTRRLAD